MTMDEKKIEKMKYEEAIAALEEVINVLESENLTLEESLENFEIGQSLARHCASLLKNAELKIRTIAETDME
jgi:exodeoxyribonuclease VII small subunit